MNQQIDESKVARWCCIPCKKTFGMMCAADDPRTFRTTVVQSILEHEREIHDA